MYKIPEGTLFIGKNLVYAPECRSTNLLASELGQKVGTPDGTVIITDRQTAGRGQRGNTWESQPGKNLTFSMILKPGFLAVKDQFQLNEAISIGISDYLTANLTQKVHIKWPNDLLVDGKKICGILIENHVSGEGISHVIVGVGLNVNQTSFVHPQAASLSIFTGLAYNLAAVFEELLQFLEMRYLELRQGKQKHLEKRYLELLYKKDEAHTFNSGQRTFEGTITGINQNGQLNILVEGREMFFGAKEVTFL